MKRRTFLKSSALATGASLLAACGREEVQYLVQSLEREPGRPGVGRWLGSVCGQCAAGCGTTVRIVDGDARKLEGQPEHPVNHGGLCALGQAGLQEHYNPDRIRTPLRRVGERGSGTFQEISWEEALAEAAEALARAGDRLQVISGGRSSFVDALLARLTTAIAAPGPVVLEPPGAEVERAAAAAILGLGAGERGPLPGYDLAGADYVLSIGPAFLDRGHQAAHGTWAMSRLRAGRAGRRGKLVQVEARMSQTGAFADEWLPARLGTEGVLARAIAGVIREAGLVRPPAADDALGPATTYDRLFPTAAPTVDEAAAICDVPAAKIRRVALELARAERPLVLGGGSAALAPNGLFNTAAALAINLLLGGLGPGGGLALAAPGAARGLLPEGTRPRSAGELDGGTLGDGGTWLFVEADPAHTRPPGRGWPDALAGAASVICLGSFLDDTTRQADLVLPLHSDIERFQATRPAGLATPVVSLSRPAAEPLYDTRHPGDIVIALAAALDHRDALPWDDFAAAAQAGFEGGGYATTWSEALDAGHAQAAEPAATTAEPGAAAEGAAPTGVEERAPAEPAEMTLILFESAKYGDGRGANKPWLQELPDTLTTFMWSSWAEISVADAEAQHIATGDLLEVATGQGSITVPAAVRPEARPGTVSLPLGGGYADYGRYARGRGANPLQLVGTEAVAGTGEAALSGAAATVRRLGRGEVAVYGRGLRDAEHIPTGWAPMQHGGADE